MAVELEIKFCTTESVLEQMEAGISGEEKRFSMETTYYDTPDRDLSARHITLRRRMENDLSVCTLKAPAQTGRLEFELEKAAIEDAIPELCKLSNLAELPALLEKGVEPVCAARFVRIAKTVTYSDTTIEVALDQGVLLGGGREEPLCEVEFELKAGSEQQLRQYAAAMALRYGLHPERRSKFARAAALAKGE
jgi:triphosphatase